MFRIHVLGVGVENRVVSTSWAERRPLPGGVSMALMDITGRQVLGERGAGKVNRAALASSGKEQQLPP